MGDKLYLTAKEAREMATTSSSMKNHLYKQIREEAKDCHTSTVWCVYGTSEDIIAKLIHDLESDGYAVSRDTDDEPDTLLICW